VRRTPARKVNPDSSCRGHLISRQRPAYVLLMIDGIFVLIWFLQALLLPNYPAITYPGLAVSVIAEVGLALWLLLLRGVKVLDSGAGLPG
jgi:hypothetical protein